MLQTLTPDQLVDQAIAHHCGPDAFYCAVQRETAIECLRMGYAAFLTTASYHDQITANLVGGAHYGTTLTDGLWALMRVGHDGERLRANLDRIVPLNERAERQIETARNFLANQRKLANIVESADKCADLMSSILDIARAGAGRS